MPPTFPIRGLFQMPTPTPATASSDAPALLRIEGPIATITLNRPGAFNSIDLSIAKKLEQLGAEVDANHDIRVLVIEGEGRAAPAAGALPPLGAAAAADSIAPVVGELLKHYHAFIETVRRMPKIVLSSVHGSAAGAGMRRRRCPLHAGLRQNWRVAGRRQHRRHGRHRGRPPRAADISRRGQLFGPAGA